MSITEKVRAAIDDEQATRARRAAEVVEDMDNLRHMLGAVSNVATRDWGYRNYYNATPGDASMLRLVEAGLAEQTHRDYYRATDAGMRAIGLTPKQMKKARGER